MAGLAKLGEKSRSKHGAKKSNINKVKARKEKHHEKITRLKKELPWPYNTSVSYTHLTLPTIYSV